MNTHNSWRFVKYSFFWQLFLIFSLVCSLPVSANNNQKKFSGDHLKYPSELSEVLSHEEATQENEIQLKNFEKFWTVDSVLTDDQKNQIIALSNSLIEKPSQNKTYFFTYIKIIQSFFQNDYAKSHYENWTKGVSSIVDLPESKMNDINDLLEFTLDLITKKTLCYGTGFSWKVDKDKYNFSFRDNIFTIRYDDVNLICTNLKDSIFILSTSGTFKFQNREWVGKGGKVTWARSKYPDNEIFATLTAYRINLKQNFYSADSASFTNKDYFDKPSLGKISDRLIKDYTSNDITYPEFQSYNKWFEIKNLFTDIDYEGGFIMRGSRLIGMGSNEKLATIVIKRNKKEFLRVEGNILIFQRQVLNSEKASIRFKFDKDSIYHSGLNFNYNDKNRTVTINSSEKLLSQSPYSSSYHKISISANQLTWKLDEDKISFGAATGTSIGRASFESNNFFNEEQFDRMMGPDERHPLLALANYSRKVRSKYFLAEDIAKYLKKPIEQVRIEMMRIAMQGYIFYNYETDEIQINNKLYDAEKARGGRIDYDVIKFGSLTQGNTSNAVLDLKTMDLLINGVENISVSDSQNVHIYPANNQIVMRKNRDFYYAGAMRAGLFTFYGKEFDFDYTNFKIILQDIDSMHIDYMTKEYDMYGQRILENITSTFEKIKGDLLIDKPDNKSGLVANPTYPIFNCSQNSFIYYDDVAIHNGVYERDSFYFEVFPFQFTNLNKFEQSDMNFKGILYSTNILAPIEDSLVLRPDNSLGFVNTTPPEGYAMYQGKGRVFNKIDLSNQGLRAYGEIKYITSTTKSDDFYLFPDSMVTKCTQFAITQQMDGIQYPETNANVHEVKWLPKKEKMHIKQGLDPMKMFENQALLSGDLLLEPLGLTGKGTIKLDNAKMISQKFEFNAQDFKTDSTSLELYTPGLITVALTSDNLKAKIDFYRHEGMFRKNGANIFARLEQLKYDSYLDQFHWGMNDNELTLSSSVSMKPMDIEKFYVSDMADKDSIPPGSLFYSSRFDEDSLYFFSPNARFDLKTSELKADSVKYLIVADAKIVAKKNKLIVNPETRLQPLKEALVLTTLKNKYHKIFNADLKILSRKNYTGKGNYNYIDERDSIYILTFNEIKVNEQGNTTATTIVTEPDSFKLSPYFAYIGNISLNSPDPYLLFKGGAKPLISCRQINPSWLRFESTINPDSIFIPIEEPPFNLNMVRLINGSIIRQDSIKLYGSILGARKDYEDVPIVQASGFMNFNKVNRRYIIAPAHKIYYPDSTGNSVSLQKDYCWMFGDGKINLPINLGQVKLIPTGSIIHRLEENLLTLDMVLQFNFHFNQKSLEAMAADLNQYPMLEGIDLKRKIYRKTLYERINPREATIAMNQINLFGAMSQIPEEFESTITLAEIKMRWNPKTQSFISSGKIGVGSIGSFQVNKKVNGFLEIVRRRSGDFMTLYLHLAEDKYYVFTYTKGSMQVSSHNLAFVDPIKQQKANERRARVAPGQQKYYYLIGTNRELSMARQRYKQIQDGEDSSDILDEVEKQDVNDTAEKDENTQEKDETQK